MIGQIEITYDGNDATRHVIDAVELSESLAGFARILSTAGHFALTGEFVKKAPAQNTRVYVTEAQPKCFNLIYEVWEIAQQQQIFQGFAGAILGSIATYVVARAANKRDEVKYLAEALKNAIAANTKRDEAMMERMFETINKMADSLRPAVRQAVTPIGGSAGQITVNGQVFDKADKDVITALSENEVTEERHWSATITELDREKATGKVRLQGDEESRTPITITDPTFRVVNNVYITAFMRGTAITLIGKAELSDGDIKRLYVSDAT